MRGICVDGLRYLLGIRFSIFSTNDLIVSCSSVSKIVILSIGGYFKAFPTFIY